MTNIHGLSFSDYIIGETFKIANPDLYIYPCFYKDGNDYCLKFVTNKEADVSSIASKAYSRYYDLGYSGYLLNYPNQYAGYGFPDTYYSNPFSNYTNLNYPLRNENTIKNLLSSCFNGTSSTTPANIQNCFFLPDESCVNAFQERIREYGCIDVDSVESLYDLVKNDWWRYHRNTRTDPSQRDKSKDDDMSSEGKGTDKDGKTRHTKGIDPEKVNNGMRSGRYNEEETTGKKPSYEHGHATPDNNGVIVGESGQNGRYMTYDEIMALINEQIARNPNPYGDPNYDPAKDVQPEKDPQATTKPNQPTPTPPRETNGPTPTPINKDENFPDNIGPILPSGDSEGVNWYERFPFCIPFDIAHTVEKLNAQAKPPSFVVPYTVKSINYKQNVEVKLEDDTWEKVRNITRWFILIIFVVGLAILTRTIIRG